MNMKNILFSLFLILSFLNVQAQIDENPINLLAKRTAQNEMFTYRFFRDFLYYKSNVYQKKTQSDLDKSIAKFDDNLNQIILFLPKDKDVEKEYLTLQNYWNVFRLDITDLQSNKVKKLATKTLRFNKLLDKFNKSILDAHPKRSSYKKKMKKINRIVECEQEIEKSAIAYVLERGMKDKTALYFNPNLSSVKSNLKKIFKEKKLSDEMKEHFVDMTETIKNIEILLTRETYHPKLMFAYVKSFSKRSFQVLDLVTK